MYVPTAVRKSFFGVAADIADMYPVCVSARGP
jgi:hypothetical protein